MKKKSKDESSKVVHINLSCGLVDHINLCCGMVHQRRDDDDGGDKDDRPGHHHDDDKVDKDLGTCHSRRQMRPLNHCVWPF